MAGHLSAAAATKALVFAFLAVALFAASSTAQDDGGADASFEFVADFVAAAAAPAPAPAIAGDAAHSAMASGAMIICLPLFVSVLALFNH